jgi:hypothetical protein
MTVQCFCTVLNKVPEKNDVKVGKMYFGFMVSEVSVHSSVDSRPMVRHRTLGVSGRS